MAGPSPDYLAQLQAGFDAGAVSAGIAPPAPPAPTTAPYGSSSLPPGVAPIALPGVPHAAPETYGPPVPEPSGPPASAVPVAPMPSQVPAQDVDPTQVEYRPVGGGGIPAHEAYMRGPKQDAHLMAAFEPPAKAAGENELRSYMQAQHESAMYEDQAKAAMERQDAANRVMLRRQQEMQAMQADYEQAVDHLGQMHLDQNRWFANQSTGDKIANVALMFAGGFFGGPNQAAGRIYKQIDQDIEAQKFDYETALDRAKGKQTAFGMMMQRYGSEDAATAAARAAALDYAAAKVNQEAAQWKGTLSQNDAASLLANIAATRENTIAAGFRFIPAQASTPKYQMAFRGRVAPGLFSEKEAQANFLKHQTDPAQEADKTITAGEVSTAGGIALAQAKAAAEAKAKGQENVVVLPSGESVNAPGATEAKDLRDLSAADLKVRQLVARAKALREEGFRTNPGNMGELESIQQQLRTSFSVAAKLGALSKEDLKIADGAVGELTSLTSVTSAPDRALDSYANMVRNDVSNRVKTYQGGREAAPKTTGKLPATFTKHSSKK